jgi:hypothetical protein
MDNIRELSTKATDAISGIKVKFDNFVSEHEAFGIAVVMFLAGIIIGMLISPRKNVSFGPNNTTNNYGKEKESEEDKEAACCGC